MEQIALNHDRRPDATVKFIFPGKKDGVPRVDCSGAERIKKAAELPDDFRPFHGLRHNFGVTLANSGKFNISEISEALTHKNLTFTTERYAQFLPDTLTKIGNSAASILNIPTDPVPQKTENESAG
jgi:integrase